MSEEENAALADDGVVIESAAVETVTEPETAPLESAPAEGDAPTEQKTDNVQKRINKLVGQRSQAERERDEARDRIKELEATQTSTAPTLESFDYDEDKHRSALIQHEVQQSIKSHNQEQQQASAQQQHKQVVDDFQAKGEEFAKANPKYWDNLNAIPTLPAETLGTVMRHESGIELANYLGEHLDVATDIANMSPYDAAVKIGVLSTELGKAKEIKPSAAPDPIEPIKSGGSLTGDEWSSVGGDAQYE